jgi:hypothetical protein
MGFKFGLGTSLIEKEFFEALLKRQSSGGEVGSNLRN